MPTRDCLMPRIINKVVNNNLLNWHHYSIHFSPDLIVIPALNSHFLNTYVFIWPSSGWAWPFSHFSLCNSFLCYFWALSFYLFVTNMMGTLVLILFFIQHKKASPDIFYKILLMLQLLVPFLQTFIPKEMMSYCTYFTVLSFSFVMWNLMS